MRAPRPCRHPGCRVAVRTGSYCERHRSERSRGMSASRAEALRFYTSKRWREFRVALLEENPWCVECQRLGSFVRATEVDHIVPRRERPDLSFARTNAQSMCKSHHSAKTRSGR